MESWKRSDGCISSDDGFSSLVEKALLVEEISHDNVASVTEDSMTTCNSNPSRDALDNTDTTLSKCFKFGSMSTTRDTSSVQSDYQNGIGPSTLCNEARKKTSLPMETMQTNLSTPSTSETSVSDGFDECMYVVTKLKEMPKLHRAVWRGDLIKVKSIGNGIRKTVLNTRDKEHRTALHLACAKGAKEIINFLCSHLKSIIDVNLQDLNGCTPIHKLIDNGHGCDGSLEMILECGGNLNLANNFGHTPLHLAARRGDAVTASFLVFKGASVHAMDQVGRTPLHLAVQNNSEEVITNLIMYGADIRSHDKMGRTPLMVAKRERLAKFMYDLFCDQENRQQLLTEADYSTARTAEEEIAKLQPLSNEETRTRLLNEWNLPYSDESDASSLESAEGTENSNQTIKIEGNQESGCRRRSSPTPQEAGRSSPTLQEAGCSSPTLQEAEVQVPSFAGTCSTTTTHHSKSLTDDGREDKCQGNSFGLSVSRKMKPSSSKSSLDRYYSVASVFKCEHFKSIDRRLSCRRDESSDDHSNIGYTLVPLFCQNTCFCSATSTIGTTASKSTSTEIPTSSYSQVDTSTSNFSSSETESKLYTDAMEDSDASYGTANVVDRSNAGAVVGLSNNKVNSGDGKVAISSESSYTTVTLEDLSEEFFTDTVLEKEKHSKRRHKVDPMKCHNVGCNNVRHNSGSVGCDNAGCDNTRSDTVGYDNVGYDNVGCNNVGCRCGNVGCDKIGCVNIPGNIASMNVVKCHVETAEDEDENVIKCGSVNFPPMPLLRRSSSTSELVTGAQRRPHADQAVTKQSSAREMMTHTPQLTQRIKGLRQKLLKDYEGKSTQGNQLQEGEIPMKKLVKLTDDTTKLRQELLSSQMLNSAQENTIQQLKLQVKMKEHENMLLEEKQEELMKSYCEKLNHCEQENHALLWQLEENCAAKQALLHKLEDNVQAKQDLVQELEDAYGANQELLLTLKDADRNKEQMLMQIQKAKTAVTELWQKLKATDAVKDALQRELEKAVGAKIFDHRILLKLKDVDSEVIQEVKELLIAKKELIRQLEDVTLAYQELKQNLGTAAMDKGKQAKQLEEASVAKGKLQLEVLYAKNALEEVVKKLDDSSTARKEVEAELMTVNTVKEENVKVAENAKQAIKELEDELADADATNNELRKQVEDAAIARMEYFQAMEDARSEIEDLKQKVNQTNASKEDLLKETEEAAIAKMEMFQELQNAKSSNDELKQALGAANRDKKAILEEVEATRNANGVLQKQLKDTYITRQELLQQVKDAVITRKDLLKKAELADNELQLGFVRVHDDARKQILEDGQSDGRSESATGIDDEPSVYNTHSGKREVVEFTVTLDSNNSDLLSVMNNSEQQWSEAEHLRQKLLQERDEMCEQAMQLRSSIERQMKEKEQLSQENTRLHAQMKESIESLERKYRELEETAQGRSERVMAISRRQSSLVRFLEAKIVMLESALQSTQCMAREYSLQCDALRQACIAREETLRTMETTASEQREEMEMVVKNAKDLESILEICKRRIAEQNGNNTHLLDKINSLQVVSEDQTQQDSATCPCSSKIASLDQNLAVLRKEVEYSKKTCILLEGNGRATKAEMNKLYAEMGKMQASVEQMATMRDHWEKDASEARKIMKEQLKFKDETIVAYMRKVKKLKEQNTTASGKDSATPQQL